MGLKDRLRETAQVAQEGLAKGQAKLEEYNARQASNDDLRLLGQAYWVQQSGRATPEQLQEALETLGHAIRATEITHGELPWPEIDPEARAAAASPGAPTAAPTSAPTAAPAGVPTSAPTTPPGPGR